MTTRRGTTKGALQLWLRSIITICAALLSAWQIWFALAQEAAPVVINEVAYRGTSFASSDEWIELYNTTPFPIDLSLWRLVIGDKTIDLTGSIAGRDYYLLERTDDQTVSDLPADRIYSGSLTDSGVLLQLRNEDDQVVDQISQFYVDLASPPAGFSTRSSMERINPFISGDIAFNWAINDQVTTNGLDGDNKPLVATPKSQNSATIFAFGYGYGYIVPPAPPQPPSSFTAVQVDHRVQLSWEPVPHTLFYRLSDGSSTTDLSPITSTFVQPLQAGPTSYQLQATNSFLQTSEPAQASLQYTLPEPPAPSSLLINELQTLPPPGEKEWVELFNTTSNWLDLSSCTLQDAAGLIHTFTPTDAIGPSAHFTADLSAQKMNNAGDHIELHCGNLLLDQIIYGNQSTGEPYISSQGYDQALAYLPDPNGLNTLGRSPDGNSLWFLLSHQDFPTKNQANPDLRPVQGVTSPSFVSQGDQVRVSWDYPEDANLAGVKIFLSHSFTDFEPVLETTVFAPEDSALLSFLPNDFIDIRLVSFNAEGIEAQGLQISTLSLNLLGLEISEVLPQPKSGLEFIELHNTTDDFLDLTDYELDVANVNADINDPSGAVLFSDFVLAPGEYFAFFIDPDFYGFRLSNTRALISIFDDFGLPVASFDYLAPAKGTSVILDGDLHSTLIHPTPNGPNIFANEPPRAVLTIQGSGKRLGCSTLSFNTTGANSSDPDEDELRYSWIYKEKTQGTILFASTEKNPLSFKFTEDMGEFFVATLTVVDPFLASDSKSVDLELQFCNGKKRVPEDGDESNFTFSTDIIINELFPNPSGRDKGNEFVELFNGGDKTIPLDGWRLRAKKKSSLKGLKILPHDFLIFKKTTLVNSSSTIELLDPRKDIIDQVSYSSVIENKSYSRDDQGQFHWTDPTPGQANLFTAPNQPDLARVVKVIDGDTIDVEIISTGMESSFQGGRGAKATEGVERIRLIGVDTPETVHPFKPLEFFGKEASDYTKARLNGQTVRLEYDLAKRGKYGRLLAYLFIDDTHFNAELIAQGYAFAYLKYPFKYREEFRQLEEQARLAGLGMWRSEDIIEIREQQEEVIDEELEELEILEELFEEPEEETVEEELEEEDEQESPVINPRGWDQVFLNEVLANPKGKDSEGQEYFELVNQGPQRIDLTGWQVVNAKGKAIFTFDEDLRRPLRSLSSRRVSRALLASRSIKNKEETLQLLDPTGEVRDTLSYTQPVKDDQAWSRNPLTSSWQLLPAGSPGQPNQPVLLTTAPDADSDGLSDAEEERLGLDPSSWDSDQDNLPDDFELLVQHEQAESYPAYLRESLTMSLRQTQRTLTFSGSSRPYTTVQLTLYSTPQTVLIPVNADGSWSYKVDLGLEAGPHRAEVVALDPQGQRSLEQEPLSFHLDRRLNASKLPKKKRAKKVKPLFVIAEDETNALESSIISWDPETLTLQLSNKETLMVSQAKALLLATLLHPGQPIRYTLARDGRTLKSLEILDEQMRPAAKDYQEPLLVFSSSLSRPLSLPGGRRGNRRL